MSQELLTKVLYIRCHKELKEKLQKLTDQKNKKLKGKRVSVADVARELLHNELKNQTK